MFLCFSPGRTNLASLSSDFLSLSLSRSLNRSLSLSFPLPLALPPTNEYLYGGLILGLCHSSNQCVSLQWPHLGAPPPLQPVSILQWPHLGALPLLQPMSIFTVASSWGSATLPTNKYLYSGLILGLCNPPTKEYPC